MTHHHTADASPGLGQVGSATLELTILTPALLLLLVLVIAAGRITLATGVLEQAAAAAARQASLERTPAQATAAATTAARSALDERDLHCTDLVVTADTTGYAVPVGQPAKVTVALSCTLSLAGLSVPGLPGSRTLHADAVSVLDTYSTRALGPVQP